MVAVLAFAVPASAAPKSGLRGIVMRAPVSPVCSVQIKCSAPAKGVELAFVRRGHTWKATTDANGRYRIMLRPGIYTVEVTTGIHEPKLWRVTVRRGVVAVHNFTIDTGIR